MSVAHFGIGERCVTRAEKQRLPVNYADLRGAGCHPARRMPFGAVLAISIVGGFVLFAQPPINPAWKLRVIDNSSIGADGVRLTDVDKDGLLDITTGWEEGGRIRVYRNPGPRAARNA